MDHRPLFNVLPAGFEAKPNAIVVIATASVMLAAQQYTVFPPLLSLVPVNVIRAGHTLRSGLVVWDTPQRCVPSPGDLSSSRCCKVIRDEYRRLPEVWRSESAECCLLGVCGTPFNAQPGAPATGAPPAGWQPPANFPPPPTNDPPPPPGFQPPPPGFPPPPPGAYPPPYPVGTITGDNTKWALGLGIAGIFCCGPFTAIPGIFLAKKDMDEFAAGRAPHLNEGMAKAAFYLNIIALGLFVVGLCFFWGRLRLHHF